MAFQWYRRMLVVRPYITSGITSGVVLAAGDGLAQYIERRQYRSIHSDSDTASLTHPALAWQYNRTAILSFWGTFCFSPFFTKLFHWLEHHPQLGAKTPRNIAVRVGTIWLLAMPLNAAFFVYTSVTEHFLPVHRFTAQDMQKQIPANTIKREIVAAAATPASAIPAPVLSSPSPSSTPIPTPSPTPTPTARELISARIQYQMYNTYPIVIRNALLVWGPWNVVSQTLISVQWRVVAGSAISVAWNTWLSLAAHKHHDHHTPITSSSHTPITAKANTTTNV